MEDKSSDIFKILTESMYSVLVTEIGPANNFINISPELILSLVIDFMTKPTECLQVSISSMQSFLQKDPLLEMTCAPQVSGT